jgi:hypothetical protein
MAIFLIAIRLWNGRKASAFPKFCDPDIARYVINYEIKNNHTYKKGGSTAFDFLDGYNVPAVDKRYHESIANNLDHPSEGLRKLVESEFGR